MGYTLIFKLKVPVVRSNETIVGGGVGVVKV